MTPAERLIFKTYEDVKHTAGGVAAEGTYAGYLQRVIQTAKRCGVDPQRVGDTLRLIYEDGTLEHHSP